MNLTSKLAGLMIVALVPAFADSMPVAGSGSGTFSSPTGGSVIGGGSTWWYSGNSDHASTLTFAGNSFPGGPNACGTTTCTTPVTVDLGTLTDANNKSANTNQDLTATLTIDVNFTNPGGGLADFPLTIGLSENINSSHQDNVLDLGNFNGASTSFVIGGEKYTVTLEGFTANSCSGPCAPNGSNALSSLTTDNDSNNSADLWAQITSAPNLTTNTDTPAVPEPASVLLLATIGGAVAFASRKRRKA